LLPPTPSQQLCKSPRSMKYWVRQPAPRNA